MKRIPLRRTAFRRQRAEGPTAPREPKPWAAPTVKALSRGTYAGSTSGAAVGKENALQHSGYMAAVRALGYCMNCGRRCRPEFAHADAGKGERLKTDCRLGWPGCGDCHALLGGHAGGGRMSKEQRRALELDLGRRTREAVKAAGTWPARLPEWRE